MTESTRVLDLFIELASINSYVGQEGKLDEAVRLLLAILKTARSNWEPRSLTPIGRIVEET